MYVHILLLMKNSILGMFSRHFIASSFVIFKWCTHLRLRMYLMAAYGGRLLVHCSSLCSSSRILLPRVVHWLGLSGRLTISLFCQCLHCFWKNVKVFPFVTRSSLFGFGFQHLLVRSAAKMGPIRYLNVLMKCILFVPWFIVILLGTTSLT